MTVAEGIKALQAMEQDMELRVLDCSGMDGDALNIPHIYTMLVPKTNYNQSTRKYWWESSEWRWPNDPPEDIENYRTVIVIA